MFYKLRIRAEAPLVLHKPVDLAALGLDLLGESGVLAAQRLPAAVCRHREKQAAREAKWAEQDRIYEEKQAAKAQKKLEKQRARKLKALKKLEKKAQKEYRLLQKYINKEQAKTKKP